MENSKACIMNSIEATIREYFKRVYEGFDFSGEVDGTGEAVEHAVGGYVNGYNMMKCAPEEWREFVKVHNLPECSGIVLKRCIQPGEPKLPQSSDEIDIKSIYYAKRYADEFPSEKYLQDFIFGAMHAKAGMVCKPDSRANMVGVPIAEIINASLPKLTSFAETMVKKDYTNQKVLHLGGPALYKDGFTYNACNMIGYAHTTAGREDNYGGIEYDIDDEIKWTAVRWNLCEFQLQVNSTWEASHEYGQFSYHSDDHYPSQLCDYKIKKDQFTGEPAEESIDKQYAYPRFQIYAAVGNMVDFSEFDQFIKDNDLRWDSMLEYDDYSYDYDYYQKGDNYTYGDETFETTVDLDDALNRKVDDYCKEHMKKVCIVKLFNDPHDVNGEKFDCTDDIVLSERNPYEIVLADSEMRQLSDEIRTTITKVFKNTVYKKFV